jgi:hypothetical protein
VESFASLALRPDFVRRAVGYGVVVGGLLIAINHGDTLLSGELEGRQWWKIVLTPMVPYCVSTLSSVSALRKTSR